MCLVCKEWIAGKITNKEALRNVGEMISTEKNEKKRKHFWKVSESILDKEMNQKDPDPDLEKQWWDETYEDA